MGFHYDQQLKLPAGKRFVLKRWLVENESERGFWYPCEPGRHIAILESEGREFHVTILFRGALTRLWVAEGDEITSESFVLQWVADAEDLPKAGRDFEVSAMNFHPDGAGNSHRAGQ
jgi:hypothetical protein